MRGTVAVEKMFSRLIVRSAAIACASAVGCVGEIVPGTSVEAAEAGTNPEDGAPPPPPGKLGDAAVKQDAAGQTARDGSTTVPSEAGVAGDSGSPVTMTVDSGAPMGMPDASTPDAGAPPGNNQIPVFVAVGYSGVRLASRDLGKTWGNIVTSGGSGDDNNLLRAAAYGNGVFVAAGWRIWTSSDAIHWTEQTNAAGQWVGGMKFGNNLFVAAGGYGTTMYSSDGLKWTEGMHRNTEPGRSLAFGNNQFVTATDSNNWWSSTDGNNWSVLSSGHSSNQVMWCTDHFSDPANCSDPLARNSGHTAYGAGVYVSAGSGYIERSEDGKTWTKTQDTSANPVEDVTFGYVNP